MQRQIPRHTLDGQLPQGLIIDARSPAEFALDHIPGAINLPTLDDAQRHEVGTLYTQVSPFQARLKGAAYANRNIADYIDRHAHDWAPGLPMWVYCWRGGQRSGSLALVLNEIGFKPTLINGGYKHWRHQVMAGLPDAIHALNWRVLSGATGTGKTELLHALRGAGEYVLDLEGLANHRGSLLGHRSSQPTQRAFETQLYWALKQIPAGNTVWVESESARIGQLTVPEHLMTAIYQAPNVEVLDNLPSRVERLIRDYQHYCQDGTDLKQQLGRLRGRYANAQIDGWFDQIDRQDWPGLVEGLLVDHYDPTYAHGQKRLSADRKTVFTRTGMDLPACVDGLIETAQLANNC